MKKILIGAIIVVAVLLVVAVIAVGFFLDSIVKTGVETVGPQVTKVDIKLDSVRLSLLGGSAKIKGLVVGNPEGYKSAQAISVGTVSVAVSPGSLLSDKIVVKSIVVQSPEITFEGGPMKNNLNAILDNVNAAAGGDKPEAQKPAKKLQVDEFTITGAKVHIDGGPTIPLPDIHLSNLGTGAEGITPADLTQRVLSAVVTGTLKAVAETGISEVGKQAGEAAGGAVNKVGKGIGDLFKKK